MTSKLMLGCAAAVVAGLLGFEAVSAQTILSPTQSELLTLEYADFIDNMDPGDIYDTAAVHSVAMSGDNAKVTFSTGYDINDDLYRVALEVPADSWTGDLTGLDAFSISFSNPVIPANGTAVTSIGAQIFVRHGGSLPGASGALFTSSQFSAVAANGLTTINIPTSVIASQQMTQFGAVDLSDITSFGVELFGGNGFDEFNPDLVMAMVDFSMSPQPPTLEDHVLYSWENGADLQGWDSTPITPGAHAHVVRQGSPGDPAMGATDGLNALQITRHPTTNFFEWGTAKSLQPFANTTSVFGDYNNDSSVNAADYTVWRNNLGTNFDLPNRNTANTGNVGPDDYNTWKTNFGQQGQGPDPQQQAEIDQIVSLINDPNAYSIAFDLTIEPQAPNPDPQYMIVDLGISTDLGPDGGGNQFFQVTSGVSVPGAGVPQTIEFALSNIMSNGMSLADTGLWEDTTYLTFHFSTNMNILSNDVVFTIDNFRIRTIVPEPAFAFAFASAVPEPASIVVALTAVLGGLASLRRRL